MSTETLSRTETTMESKPAKRMHGPKLYLFLTSSLCIACLSMSQTHDHWPPSINMYEINWGAESWSLWLNVLVPKFKEFAIWLAAELSHQPFAFADPLIWGWRRCVWGYGGCDSGLHLERHPRLTQNMELQTKYFVVHNEMENECSLNKRKLR